MVSLAKVRISEIFFSLQGETSTVGLPTVFVRLTGCPLRCQYCDTTYAFQGGQWVAIEDVLGVIKKYHTQYVTVTGGEPLAQPACHRLLASLCDAGYTVSLETSGALDISRVDSRVVKIMDIKTPGSGEESKNRWDNIAHLTAKDEVKFVICNRADYEWAKEKLIYYALAGCCRLLFSPSYQELSAGLLADWIVQDQLPVRMQIQLHKFLWGDVPGR